MGGPSGPPQGKFFQTTPAAFPLFVPEDHPVQGNEKGAKAKEERDTQVVKKSRFPKKMGKPRLRMKGAQKCMKK